VTHLRQIMLEELERRNIRFAQSGFLAATGEPL